MGLTEALRYFGFHVFLCQMRKQKVDFIQCLPKTENNMTWWEFHRWQWLPLCISLVPFFLGGIGSMIHLPYWVYVCMHKYACLNGCACMYVHIHTYTHVCVCFHMYVCVCMHVCYVPGYMCLCTYMCVFVCVHLCTWQVLPSWYIHLQPVHISFQQISIHSQVNRLFF